MPEMWEQNFEYFNVKLRGIETNEVPLVQFDITFPGGRWTENPDQNGRLSLLANLMNEGTASKTPAEFEQAVGLLGSGITVTANTQELTISATTLARNFEETVALVQEAMTEPRWEIDDFDRVKSAALTGIKGREANPNAIATTAFNQLLYGAAHPYGRPAGGNVQTVSDLKIGDLKTAHAELMTTLPRLHVVGDIDRTRATKGLRNLVQAISTETIGRLVAAGFLAI